MSLIKNLVEDREERKQKKNKDDDEKQEIRPIGRSPYDLQRFKLEKLMKNPDKPIEIPDYKSDNDYMKSVPTFVRNVMGSSAGAGSGEFHVYRHLRRKEFARQKMIERVSIKEKLEEDFQKKMNENRRISEEKTAKKRAKRLKKKSKKLQHKAKQPKLENVERNIEKSNDSAESEQSEEEEENNTKHEKDETQLEDKEDKSDKSDQSEVEQEDNSTEEKNELKNKMEPCNKEITDKICETKDKEDENKEIT